MHALIYQDRENPNNTSGAMQIAAQSNHLSVALGNLLVRSEKSRGAAKAPSPEIHVLAECPVEGGGCQQAGAICCRHDQRQWCNPQQRCKCNAARHIQRLL